jgi:hypothetical protein
MADCFQLAAAPFFVKPEAFAKVDRFHPGFALQNAHNGDSLPQRIQQTASAGATNNRRMMAEHNANQVARAEYKHVILMSCHPKN